MMWRRTLLLALSAALLVSTAAEALKDPEDAGPSPSSCCSNLDRKTLKALNNAETIEWLECNQIDKQVIDIVKRERVLGYELNAMTQEEMSELLQMTQIHAWRVARCKTVTTGTRRWTSKGLPVPDSWLAGGKAEQEAAAAKPSAGKMEPRRGAACKYTTDLTGKRCFGFTAAPDPSWTPASCKQQCCRRINECKAWLYSYAEGCWFSGKDDGLNCKDEPGWFGAAGHVP